MADPKNDPEAQYRRGYEHGAWEVYRELQKFLPSGIAGPVLEWLEHKIEPWRLDAYNKALQGEQVPEVTPPHLRLKNSD
jgi:hypothetical protein